MTARAPYPPRIGVTVSWPGAYANFPLLFLLLTCWPLAAQQQSASPDSEFRQVEALIMQGNLDEAKAGLLDELKRNPSSVEGYNLLGIIESDQRDYFQALSSFHQALRLSPNSTKTHNNLGNVYVAQKRPDLAEKEFANVLRLDPANREGNYNLGILLLARGAPGEAIVHFQRVHPTDLPTGFQLVRAYLEDKRVPDAIRVATELSVKNESDVQVHFSLGVLLASEKQYKLAQLELEKADALQPGTFEILFNLGQVLFRNGDASQAELDLSRALKLKPDSTETLYWLAEVYANSSRPLDALDLLVRAHKLAPDDVDVIFLMAQESMSQNYFEDAIPLLESGLKIAPQRPDLLASLGESYFMSGKVDKSIEEFKRLIEVDPSARSYAFLGLSYRNLGRFDEAREFFEKGLKLDPRNSSCLFSLGYIEERQGNSARAATLFEASLQSHPDFADALLELANLRTVAGKLQEAEDLLRRYVKVSRDPATGYYKLAKVERSLHETAAADRDLSVFQTLSKDVSAGPYPFEHLFDYLDSRSQLAKPARDQLDLADLIEQIKKHPDQPEDLYMLSEAYLKAGNVGEAKRTIAELDSLSSGDYRTLTGLGVLLARYHLYDDAIQHFQLALAANPSADDVNFDLADAYFRKHLYSQALDAAEKVSAQGRKDDAFLSLLGDIYAHMNDTADATEILRDAIDRNPDNDQDYLSLALLQFRSADSLAAKQTLLKGQARIPASGKILWGLGLASALDGKTSEAAEDFERAVDLLPEWPGSYSTLGVFYFQTGQIAKAREVLTRFKNSNLGGLDVDRIEQVLAQAPEPSREGNEPLTMASREQFLQLALALADRTL